MTVCNENCENGELHKLECNLLPNAFKKQNDEDDLILTPPNFGLGNLNTSIPLFSCIAPLRLLLKTRYGMQATIDKKSDNVSSS